jgi:prepilin-type N-terminal cleavage/methylation domain-containing protein
MLLSKKYSSHSNSAFTLVELAIVIVVLGILVSGVLMGQSIIKSANVNSTVNDIQKMQTAMRAFELEFGSQPGDFDEAYDYFGSECGSNGNNTIRGCVGDGDLCIDGSRNSPCRTDTPAHTGDMRRSFIHLVLSEIHPDLPYVIDSSNADCTIGGTIPATAIGGAYVVGSQIRKKAFMYFFTPENFAMGGNWCNYGGFGGSVTPATLKKIDTKLDNGNGRRGIVQSVINHLDNSYSGADCDDADGNFNLSNEEKSCGFRVELK